MSEEQRDAPETGNKLLSLLDYGEVGKRALYRLVEQEVALAMQDLEDAVDRLVTAQADAADARERVVKLCTMADELARAIRTSAPPDTLE